MGIFPDLEYIMEVDILRCWQNPCTGSLTNKLKLEIIKSYRSKKKKKKGQIETPGTTPTLAKTVNVKQ